MFAQSFYIALYSFSQLKLFSPNQQQKCNLLKLNFASRWKRRRTGDKSLDLASQVALDIHTTTDTLKWRPSVGTRIVELETGDSGEYRIYRY